MKLAPKLLPALVLGGAGALALGLPANAAPMSSSATTVHTRPMPKAAITAQTPTLFTVIGTDITVSSETQARITATCPKGTVPFGGGVFTNSGDLLVNVNDSFPSGPGWIGDLNNGSSSSVDASAVVMCGHKPAHYTVVKGNTVRNPSGTHVVATAKCPTGSKPLGGGASAGSRSIFTNMAATFPQGKAWRVDENNASAGGDKLTPFAICGQVPGYQVVIGPAQNLMAEEDVLTTADCPSGLIPISGGGFASTSSVGVNLNETAPGETAGEWISFFNNDSGVNFTGSSVAVCAAFQQPII
jgi:hypothetical protein